MTDYGCVKINVKVHNRGKKARQRDRPEIIKVDLGVLMGCFPNVRAKTFENALIEVGNGKNARAKEQTADLLGAEIFAAFCDKYPELRLVSQPLRAASSRAPPRCPPCAPL